MATNAGTLFVDIQARIDKFKKNMDAAQGRLKKFSTNAANFVKQNRLAITAGVVAIGALVVKVTKAASDLEETQAKFDTVFRGSRNEAERFATDLQDNYLLSENAAKSFLASIQDTLVPMGIAREAATGLSAEVVRLAADLGSFNNVPTATVVRDLQSALVGNTETVKKYGIVLRATDIEQRALKDTGKALTKQLTQADKVTASYNIILEGSADAQGDVARTSESFANRMKGLKGDIEDLSATVGQFTIGPAGALVKWAAETTDKINKAIETVQEASVEFDGFAGVLKSVVIEAFRGLINIITIFIERMMLLNPLLKLIGVDVREVSADLNAQIDRWQATSQAALVSAGDVTAAEKQKQKDIAETNQSSVDAAAEKAARLKDISDATRAAEIEAKKKAKEEEEKLEKETNKRLKAERDKAASEQEARAQRFRDVFTTTNEDWLNAGLSAVNNFTNSFGQGLADMVLEGRKFSDVIKSIWKDIARAVISEIGRMIAKWLAFMALRVATGGVTGLLGAQFGGIISEPSVVTGLRSGVSMLAGEAGDEAIVPLQSFRGGQQNRIQNTSRFGAGNGQEQESPGAALNLTVNISGQFLEGDELKWQQLVRDRLVPEIRRNTMITPVGPFNRRRGAAI